MAKKKCTKCKNEKDEVLFYKQAKGKGGRGSECIECYLKRVNAKKKEEEDWYKMIIG